MSSSVQLGMIAKGRFANGESELANRIATIAKDVHKLEQVNAGLKGLTAAYRLVYDLEKLTDEELQIFKVENKEKIEKLFKLLNK